MVRPLAFTARLSERSSLSVWRQCSATAQESKTSRRTAMAPPQAKGLFPSLMREAIPAFQTDRRTDPNPPFWGTYQRYPVLTPASGSARGATRWRSHRGSGRMSESPKARTRSRPRRWASAWSRLWTFWLLPRACPENRSRTRGWERPSGRDRITGTDASVSSPVTRSSCQSGYSRSRKAARFRSRPGSSPRQGTMRVKGGA